MKTVLIFILLIAIQFLPERAFSPNANAASQAPKFIAKSHGSDTFAKEGNILTVARHKVTIRGIVTDMKGDPIAYANIEEKGTDRSTVTDTDGNFRLDVEGDVDLIVSYMGYKTQAVPVNGKTQFTIRLEEEALAQETIVITAMGLKKKEASLAYSTQQVSGDELLRVKDPNLMNSLTGKISSLQINRSSSGPGGSIKASIRGNSSINGNNHPLYVIDGMPMLNNSNEQAYSIMGGTADAGNRDGGDGISNLNPDDIESVSILKGASAAALYGSQAANGVILITTKKGKPGFQKATFSSQVTFDHAISLPKIQDTYGMDSNRKSWGEKRPVNKGYDHVSDFFQEGVTTVNSFSFTRGHESIQTYCSYANTYGKGIIDGNSLTRHNLNYRQSASFFNNRLTLDGNVNLIQQTIKNRPVTGGYYMNPLVGLYGYPRSEELKKYRDQFEVFDEGRNMYVQNWHTKATAFEQNPYWLTNRVLSNDKRYRTIASLNATIKINKRLSLQARGAVDHVSDRYTQKIYATTAPEIAGSYTPEGSSIGYANGRYINFRHSELLMYGDAMAMFNKTWGEWSLTGAAGGAINKTRVNSLRIDSKLASLYYPNVFTVSNIVLNSNAYVDEQIEETRDIQSLFGTTQLAWRESLYLDATTRNDWSSTLAYTRNSSFLYSSMGFSWILNHMLSLPRWISFGKIRGSWSQVGNDLPLFYSKLQDHIVVGGGIQTSDRAPFDQLKPEISTSFEVGTEWRFFNQRLYVDFTLYKTNTKNQLLTLPSNAGAEYKFYMVNAGKVENKGIEATIGATPAMTDYFRWNYEINISANRNEIVKLHPDLNSFMYGDEGFSMSYAMRLKEGGSFGDIYGWKFDRDESGKIKLNEKDLPLTIGSGNTEKVGNCSPDYMIGWSNTLSYKGFSVYFLIDSRIGGEVFSQTQAELDSRGASKRSAQARDKGYAEVNGQLFTDVQGFYSQVGGPNNTVTELYMYNATNIRLRELAISYSFPRNVLEKTKGCKGIDLSLIGRNLFFLYKDAPFDPDAVMSTGNDCQGVDVFGTPTTRSIGFNVRFTF